MNHGKREVLGTTNSRHSQGKRGRFLFIQCSVSNGFHRKKKVHQRGFILGENIRAHAVRLGFDADTFRDPRRLARQDCEAV